MNARNSLLLPLLLMACSSGPPADTAQARCTQQTNQDPEVKALMIQQASRIGDPSWQAQLDVARFNAMNACLVALGAAPRGGVEPVIRPAYGLSWF